MRMYLASASIVLTGFTITAAPAKAWNLICGVSIGLMADIPVENKWNADSNSLYGVSHFYAAVAELQRIQINDDNTFVDPVSDRFDRTATAQAAIELKNSVDSFTEGLAIAEQYNLGDEKGLGLLKSLIDGTTNLYETIESRKTLPTLGEVQAVALNISEFTAYGIELSNQHLGMGMQGHGVGGSDYIIPE